MIATVFASPPEVIARAREAIQDGMRRTVSK